MPSMDPEAPGVDSCGREVDWKFFPEAAAYAARIHRDQRRKGGGAPYVGHLMSVAGLVVESGGTEIEAIAALLHDSAEDAGGEDRIDDIRERFGARVAQIVAECTDTVESPKPPWRERKERYLDHLKDAQEGAVLVSLADKLDNVRAIRRDLERDGAKVWDRFSESDAEAHLWYHRSLLTIYRQRSDSWMVDELEAEVGRLAAWSEAAGRFRADRLAAVSTEIAATSTWIERAEAEIQGEGSRGDDWDLAYNAVVRKVLEQTRRTLGALEAEAAAIERGGIEVSEID